MKRRKNRIVKMISLTGMFSLLITACATTEKNVENMENVESMGEETLFGSNVYIFNPEDSAEEINAIIEEIWEKQESNQFGSERYALLFKPGEYEDGIYAKVGYYTQVLGLGESPDDTEITGLVCDAKWTGDDNNHNATMNFWRGAENLSIKNSSMWAVSQAVSLRRMHFQKELSLHDENGWASGGFLADSLIEGRVESGSQQQWLSRNCDWKNWNGQNWNMVFVGIGEDKAPTGDWPKTKFTTVEETPVIREKPFLTYDEQKGYRIFVPDLREDSSGISWRDKEAGTYIDIADCYVAKSDADNADSINQALEQGKHLILTPGIYQLDKAIEIKNENTVVLGLGLATLVPLNGNACIETADVDGIKIAGILFDAGTVETEVLLQVGTDRSDVSHEENPISLSDVYFRVGGASKEAAKAQTCVIINSSNVIGDNFWVWRADHGDGVGWDENTTKNGIVINGDDVTMYALMVEHFHEYQTVWNGNGGRTYFYQSELPYDIPDQESWMSHDGTVNGYASYKVADNVTSHEAWGLGIYSYHRDAVVDANCVVEAPAAADVIFHNVCSVMITGNPGISHVINDCGEAALNGGDRQIIVLFKDGEEQ